MFWKYTTLLTMSGVKEKVCQLQDVELQQLCLMEIYMSLEVKIIQENIYPQLKNIILIRVNGKL